MIHLIADSTFGITQRYAEDNHINIVNLKLILDDVMTDEGFENNWSEFYNRLEKSKNFPTTSQPSPNNFTTIIDEIYQQDSSAEIIILTISKSLSGTINCATMVTNEYTGKKIIAIDSEQASSCGELMVEEIVDKIKSGKTFEDIINVYIPKLKDSLKIQFVPASMKYLKKGGRINRLSATIASLLSIKPIFEFRKGVINVTKKVIGIGRAITEMIASLPKKLKKLYICYIHDTTNVESIKNKLNCANIRYDKIVPVGPVFGSHVGIGAIGLASLESYENSEK